MGEQVAIAEMETCEACSQSAVELEPVVMVEVFCECCELVKPHLISADDIPY